MGKGSWLQRLGLGRPPPISVAEFRERVVSEILSRDPDAGVELVGDVGVETRSRGALNVSRAYEFYRERPGDLLSLVREIADLIFAKEEPTRPEELIVLVRPDTYEAGGDIPDVQGLAHALPAGLMAIVAVDAPGHYRFPSAKDLRDELTVSNEAIWSRAMENLRRRLNSKPPRFAPGKLMGLKTDIGLASSLLVLDEFWDQPEFTDRGDWVVAPVERDEIVAVPASDLQLVAALRNLVARRDGGDFLTDRLLLRRAGRWEPFD